MEEMENIEETLGEIETRNKKEEKKRKKRERLAKLHSAINSGKSVLKEVREVCAVASHVFYTAIKDNKFIMTFLDESGILKKPNYQKEIAQNTAQITKTLQNIDMTR